MSFHPDDRPDPTAEQPIRARVPEHVAGGCFSTGVIVMTAQTEFILDFVQNLGRPHQIVARVVMPHGVLPQLVDALGRNVQLYRSRWGELPNPNIPNQTVMHAPLPGVNQQAHGAAAQPLKPVAQPTEPNQSSSNSAAGPGAGNPVAPLSNPDLTDGQSKQNPPPQPPNDSGQARQATAQEIYDDLKIRDELLSGNYANAVMIGHGPHEFSFDFITNFYPHSAVSVRVFMAAGQIPRLFDSLKGTWDQLRLRMQPPPPSNDFPSNT
jgi:Protein of unknown function (DUF3467)